MVEQNEKIEELANKMEKLADEGKYDELAELFPEPEVLAELMEKMFSDPEVAKQFFESAK